MSERTFRVDDPRMHGQDVLGWQLELNRRLRRWGVDYQLKADGEYGVATRDLTATVLHGLGILESRMAKGVSAELRVKVRNSRLTPAERARYVARRGWRRKLRARYEAKHLARPVLKVLADSWGYHPGVHDGMDLICPPAAPIYAMCDGEVARADAAGWWGKAPSGDVSKGDGIIILRCDVDAGPFKKGLHICYGHAEGAVVKEGQRVKAGQHLGHAGLAVAWHVHLMVNGRSDAKGVGDRDPRPFYDYARKHG